MSALAHALPGAAEPVEDIDVAVGDGGGLADGVLRESRALAARPRR
ncbi:hypothetical protein ACIQWR_38500 [Streptomyces sp. NPDC098789]